MAESAMIWLLLPFLPLHMSVDGTDATSVVYMFVFMHSGLISIHGGDLNADTF